MALTTERVSVTTAATLLADATYSGNDGASIAIQNPSSSVTVYLGTDVVTTASYGHALLPLSTFTIDLLKPEKLYAIVASSTLTVNVLRQGI